MFDELVVRGKIAKYFADNKKFPAAQIPPEVEKCLASVRLWCSRYCLTKEHNEKVLSLVLGGLLGD